MTAYAEAVVAGAILAGHLVRLACARHLLDLRVLTAKGYTFSEKRADHALSFFARYLRFYDAGERSGEPFRLEPWQQFIVGSLFGWLAPDGFRRFKIAYVETGKGNGKTPLLAGMLLYGATCDSEPGAQLFCAAVTREQARLLFDDAKNMAAASPALSEELVIGENNITHAETGSFIRPVSSEGRSLDGKRVHMAAIDELHEHPSSIVVDKLRLGTKGKRQALLLEITNSGYDRHSVCWQHHEYVRQLLERTLENESWFGYICQLDVCEAHRKEGKGAPVEGCPACDDWRDEAVWLKADPNLDVSITRAYLREQITEASAMPSRQNIVKRLNFCIWTEGETRWISADAWGACADDGIGLESFRGLRCFVGIDLSSTTDLTAVGIAARMEDGRDIAVTRFWVPKDNLEVRGRRDGVPYPQWYADGYLDATEGDTVDDAAIEQYVKSLVDEHGLEIAEVGYDPWNASSLVGRLQAAGFVCVPIRQGFGSLSAPSKEFEKRVAQRGIVHDGNPVMSWGMANVVLEIDAAGNIKPSKAKSTERIDGPVALILAFDRLSRHAGDEPGPMVHVFGGEVDEEPEPGPPSEPTEAENREEPDSPPEGDAARQHREQLWNNPDAWRGM